MKTPARLLLSPVPLLLAAAPSLWAHPGHDDDHGHTWELRHLAAHPLATAAWGLIALAAAGLAIWLRRRRAQSLRTSPPSRGK